MGYQVTGFGHQGRLPRPKGHDEDEWEDREQTLFRSTAFGDDMDRALMKSDGTYTYFAGDVAYHYDKLTRGYDLLIAGDGRFSRLREIVRGLLDFSRQTPPMAMPKTPWPPWSRSMTSSLLVHS